MTNEELIDKLNLQNQQLNELKKENEELKKQLKEKECFPQKKDGTIDTCEVMKENEELKGQIEKMKCWANCIQSLNCSQININSTTVVRVCKNCKDWELAE